MIKHYLHITCAMASEKHKLITHKKSTTADQKAKKKKDPTNPEFDSFLCYNQTKPPPCYSNPNSPYLM